MDARLTMSFYHLQACLNNYYQHLPQCKLCLASIKIYSSPEYFSNSNMECEDANVLHHEVKAAERLYYQKCEEILKLKTD